MTMHTQRLTTGISCSKVFFCSLTQELLFFVPSLNNHDYLCFFFTQYCHFMNIVTFQINEMIKYSDLDLSKLYLMYFILTAIVSHI